MKPYATVKLHRVLVSLPSRVAAMGCSAVMGCSVIVGSSAVMGCSPAGSNSSSGFGGDAAMGGASVDASEMDEVPATPSEAVTSVTGSYCSLRVDSPQGCVGLDAHYFSFELDTTDPSENAMTGQYCKEYGTNCFPITASVTDRTVDFAYDTGAGTYTAQFVYDPELENLAGLAYSVHCNCFIDFYLFSIDED